MVAQTEKIQNLQTLMTYVQFKQQANGAASIGGSVPGHILASITTGDTTLTSLTRKSMETMFKT